MSNSGAEELIDTIYCILEPHASFIHEEKDNDVRYFIPLEELENLAWIVLNFLLPIITGITTGVATSAISERLKKGTTNEEILAMRIQQEELAKLKAEVEAALQALKKEKHSNEQGLSLAQPSLIHILKVNGWPSDIAEEDAKQVLLKVGTQLWVEDK